MDTLANNGVLYQGLHILGSGATLTRTAGLTIHPAPPPPDIPARRTAIGNTGAAAIARLDP